VAAIGTTLTSIVMEGGQKMFLLWRFSGSSAKKHTNDFIWSGRHTT
jgi:hypothetical protein